MPDAVAYREAIQNPQTVLGDRRLSAGTIRLDRLRLPVTYTGRFAVVFRLTDRTGQEWALRCFTTSERPGQLPRALRYALIDSHLEKLPERFVAFQFHERGVRVGGVWEPLVAMGWARGVTLGHWVEKNHSKPDRLRALATRLETVRAELERLGIAHGDWQHDNLLLDETGEKVVFVDYDGMFVPELAGTDAPERGHPNYQHPARSEKHFGVGLDRFSCLVICTALLALSCDPTLWDRFGDPDRLLFSKSDLESPGCSSLFAALHAIEGTELQAALTTLEKSLTDGPETVLLPAPAAASLSLTALARLARSRETDVESWERAADEVLPWWRNQIASRHLKLDPRWAELLRSLESARKSRKLDPGEWRSLLTHALKTVAAEQEIVRARMTRIEQALKWERRELILDVSREAFLQRWLDDAKIPFLISPPRLFNSKIDTAGKLSRHRELLPKFLRQAEREPLLAWLTEQVAAAEAAYNEKLSMPAVEAELEALYTQHDSLLLAHTRLSEARRSLL